MIPKNLVFAIKKPPNGGYIIGGGGEI